MKKILTTILALYSVIAIWAQNEHVSAVLIHESTTTLFTGTKALVKAYEAAVDGDVITLSSGIFKFTPTISKSISIYGAGFETEEATGGEITNITAEFYINTQNGSTLSKVHVEGIYFSAKVVLDGPLENLVIEKCYMAGDLSFRGPNTNTTISNCIINGSITTTTTCTETKNCLIGNCYIRNNIDLSSDKGTNSITVNHCIGCGAMGSNTYTNSILTYRGYKDAESFNSPFYRENDAVVTNCILLTTGSSTEQQTYTGCYIVPLNEIFADAEGNDYDPTRTFKLKNPETWIGTDGQEVGIRYGWSKVPRSIPLKNVTTTLNGNTLTIEYQ